MTHANRVLVVLLAIGLGSCISKKVDVVPFLAPTRTATLQELVAYINQRTAIRTLVLRVDLQFETVERAGEGVGCQYRTAQGRLLLERPRRIRLNIVAPILSAIIAEMASNGERFQLLIYPPDYRALIEGRNDRSYRQETARTFRSASFMLRQLNFGVLDLELHHRYEPDSDEKIFDVQRRVADKTTVVVSKNSNGAEGRIPKGLLDTRGE